MADKIQLIEYTPEVAEAIRKARDLPPRGNGIAPWPEHNRQQLLPPIMEDVSNESEKIQFKCKYVTKNNTGTEGNFVHVYDQTSAYRAGLCSTSLTASVTIPETWVEIPENFTGGYLYLVKRRTLGDPHANFYFQFAAAEYAYSSEMFFEHVPLARLDFSQESGWSLTQLLKNPGIPVPFNDANPESRYLYLDLSNRELTAADNRSSQRIIIRSATSTLRPDTSTLPAVARIPSPDLASNTDYTVNSDGSVPTKSIVYLWDDHYRASGQLSDLQIGQSSYQQTNYQGRPLFSAANLTQHNQTALNNVFRPVIDWSSWPVYTEFQVDFTVSRTTSSSGSPAKLRVSDTATGIRVFNSADPDSQYAGHVQYDNWLAPAQTFSLPQSDSTLYLTCTWSAENQAPVIGYLLTSANPLIDGAKIWIKTLAYIRWYFDKWHISQVGDRNFDIFGRWV